MKMKAIFADKNYMYILLGMAVATVATYAAQQYLNNGQPKELMICSAIISGTLLAYQTTRMYLFSRQLTKTN